MPIIEGYLLKRGNMTTKRRYFVLDGINLTYFGAKEETVPRGQLQLGADSKVVGLQGGKGRWAF
jgi:hypothetical protein